MAGTRQPLDANHIAAWYLTDAGPTFVNAVSPGTYNMTQMNSPKPQAVSPFGLASGLANEGSNSARHGAMTSDSGPISATLAITIECWIYWKAMDSTGLTQHWFMKQQVTGNWSSTFGEHGFQNRRYAGAAVAEQWDALVRTSGSGLIVTNQDGRVGVPPFEWSHIAVTYDSAGGAGNFKVYLNGDQVNETTGTGTVVYGTGPWFMGAIPAGSGNNEEQSTVMADLRVSDIARPASYFRSVYQNGTLNVGGGILTRRYKLWAKYDNCATPVIWVDTQVSTANAPDNPCTPGTGVLSTPIILQSWEA